MKREVVGQETSWPTQKKLSGPQIKEDEHKKQESLKTVMVGEMFLDRQRWSRLSEISFVLKAIATLVISLKKAPEGKVNRSSWEQLISLYPYLVECTTTTSSQVSRSLREALLQYCDLLKPPTSYLNGL
ncbi:unnamed protein product [Timema podura]|uniref:Mon2 C-terminal domain-containing protein n=1 Tax=Timema podura TaxID=61482 RepID=A0ABN7NW37_TIMPD|nr:unnamed protein product [Timema podura]